jgi:hypothetical protein
MPASPVRPEFGPTLPELLGRRFGMSVRAAGLLLAAILAAVVVAGIVKHEQPDGTVRVVVRSPAAFNLRYDPAKLDRVAPRAGEAMRLQTKAADPNPSSVTVRGVRIPPFAGDDASLHLPIQFASVIAEMERRDPNFVLRSEGKARVNSQPGYQVQFQTSRGGRTYYGRRAWLFPDPRDQPGARDGGDVTLLAARSKVVTNPDDVGSNGVTKLPYRSFRLGTDTP